ncbi:PaeR7I family type II restriction endonuclease [Streptomyces sp. NPDC003077]|uniref:PaeR7I family type II restriction endonuclease n=1 Tax=Streptomyces sp. NPDC003077 TaxID=3154443 RepID=UPI0033B66D7E
MTVTRQDFEDAVAQYWGKKRTQNDLSAIRDAVSTGTAGTVRGGKHFDPIAGLIAKFFLDAGYPKESIRVDQGLELPGYYRPLKKWDIVVAHEGHLVAAFELKALGGPSFGNNYNNRVEEALGSAVDLRRAALAELFPGSRPWLGYFFIMEDHEKSRSPVRLANHSAFAPEAIWQGTSYQDRFAIFCQRLVDERLYNAACYITSSEQDPGPKEPAELLDWRHFSASITGRLAELKALGIPWSDGPP